MGEKKKKEKETMFAVKPEEKPLPHHSRTFEKCMSWPGSRRTRDDTLLSVTVPALCQEQKFSAAFVTRPVASHAPNTVSERSLLVDELPQIKAQDGPGRSLDHGKSEEARLKVSGFPIKNADGSTAKR